MFSGIGAPECAMPWVDWRWCAEIDRFPAAVHAARIPMCPNLGDVSKADWDAANRVDLVVFGSPCQSFSVAGKRAGLDDPRGDLTFTGLAAIGRIRPEWVVWENVPGVLSIDGGRVFGAVLRALGQLGYGFAYRVLDAQHFGVPQRRRRVFVVGCLGDWRRAAAVLFERASLSGNPQAGDKAGQEIAKTITGGSGSRGWGSPSGSGGGGIDLVAGSLGAGSKRSGQRVGRREAAAGHLIPAISPALKSRDFKGPSSDGYGDGAPLIVHSLRADGFDASEDGTGRGTPLVPVAFDWQSGGDARGLDPKDTAQLQRGQVPAIAFSSKDRGADAGDTAPTPRAMGHSGSHANAGGQVAVAQTAGVRRLTPVECEKLQGFPPGWTDIQYRGKPAADGNRYKALGNSMAVPVLRWIGERIRAVDSVSQRAAA